MPTSTISIDQLSSTIDDAAKAAKEALYVGVGAGVLAFQKVQVQRQELLKQVRPLIGDAREQLDRVTDTVTDTFEDQVRSIEGRLDAVEDRVDTLLDRLEDELPGQAADLVRQIRDAARDAREQVRSLVDRAA